MACLFFRLGAAGRTASQRFCQPPLCKGSLREQTFGPACFPAFAPDFLLFRRGRCPQRPAARAEPLPYLALPLGELSPQVTERVTALFPLSVSRCARPSLPKGEAGGALGAFPAGERLFLLTVPAGLRDFSAARPYFLGKKPAGNGGKA